MGARHSHMPASPNWNSSPKAQGAATYFFANSAYGSAAGRRLAIYIVDALSRELGRVDVHKHGRNYACLREVKPLAVMVEPGFVSHPVEGPALADPEVMSRSGCYSPRYRGVSGPFVDAIWAPQVSPGWSVGQENAKVRGTLRRATGDRSGPQTTREAPIIAWHVRRNRAASHLHLPRISGRRVVAGRGGLRRAARNHPREKRGRSSTGARRRVGCIG